MKKILLLSVLFCSYYAQAQNALNLVDWMNQHKGMLSARINQYNKEQYNLLTNQQKFAIGLGKQTQQFQQSTWEINTTASMVADKSDAIEVVVHFKCITGKLAAASVSVDMDWDNWSEKNYVLMPAAVYNGNRYEWRRLRYSPKLYEVQDIGIDKPIILTDVPKLNGNGAFSRIQERSGSMSVPSIGFIADDSKKGMWLLTEQGNQWGDYGMDIAETRDRKKAVVSITSPIVREQFVYKICDAHYPSWDIPKDMQAGDEATIKFRLYGFDAPQNQSIFDKYATIRKDYSGTKLHADVLPYAACMNLLEKKYNEKNFVPAFGYYAIGFRENFLQDWQIGWTGGMITTYPLLFSGSEATKQRVIQNFDWLFPNGIAPSGFYWDAGRNGNEWLGGDIRKPHTKNWHLVRKSGDAVWYILKQFMLMDKMHLPVKESWKSGNKRVLDAFVHLWNTNHQLGQFVNSLTGEIMVGGSSSGGIVPAGLALASQYYQQPQYLSTAEAIADYYYQNFILKGISCGGPGDAVQNFDSESALGLLESYVTLYEITGNKKWLPIAEAAAKQLSTWVVSYNYHFSDTSAYGKANVKTNGSVYANTQNKHTAPGLCTASGVGLLKLYRYTGNQFYLELLQDIAHNITQYIGHPQKPLGTTPVGYVSERVNMSDWEGVESIGYVLPLSTWAETSLMLTTIEVPGIYVETDKATVTAFDNVKATLVKATKKSLTIEITNPTPVEATVTILAESATKQQQVLGENALYGAQSIHLLPGEHKQLEIKR